MSQSKFAFDENIPAVILVELKNHLLPCEWLIPSWCNNVFVGWSDEEDKGGATITSNVEYAYRWVRLTFYPCFHTQREDSKREQVIHDLVHSFAGILADYARETIKLLIPEDEAPQFRQSVLDELQARHESFVQDMAVCITRKIDA